MGWAGWLALVAAVLNERRMGVRGRLYPRQVDSVYYRISNTVVRYNREDPVRSSKKGDVDGWIRGMGQRGPGVSSRRLSFGLGCRARRLLLENANLEPGLVA